MTPDGIRLRRHDISMFAKEACGVIQRYAKRHSADEARSVYRLDEWEYSGAEQGEMRAELALDVLEMANAIDEEARACT